MAASYKKALAALASGDALMVTHISEPPSKAGTYYALRNLGASVTQATYQKLYQHLTPVQDGLFEGASQTFVLSR